MSSHKSNTGADLVSTDVATATHQFKFSYSKTKDLPVGKCITTSAFSLGGYNCNIVYYPQGTVKRPNSMMLPLVVHCKSPVNASFGIVFLDKHGKPSSEASGRLTFTYTPAFNGEIGFTDIIERSSLEAEFVKDDYFTLLCSVTIVRDSHKEVPKQLVNGIVYSSINEDFADLVGCVWKCGE